MKLKMREKTFLRNVKISKLFSKVVIGVLIFFSGYAAFAGNTTFKPLLMIEETYHGNVFYFERYKSDDFIVILRADLPLEISSPKTTLSLIYSPFREFYRKNDELNYTGHTFRAEYDYLGRTSNLRISEFFSRTQEQGNIPEYQAYPMGLFRRTGILDNNFNVTYESNIKGTSFINLNANHMIRNYENLFQDRSELTAGFENLYTVNNIRNRVGYFYDFRKFFFEEEDSQELNFLGLIYRYIEPEKMNFMIKAGGVDLSKIESNRNGDIDLVFYCNLSKEIGRVKDLRAGEEISRGNFGLTLFRDIRSIGSIEGLSIDSRLSLGFTYNISRKSTVVMRSAYFKQKPLQEEIAQFEDYIISTSFNYRIFRKLSLSLAHRYLFQESENDDLDAKFHVLSLNLLIYPFQKSF